MWSRRIDEANRIVYTKKIRVGHIFDTFLPEFPYKLTVRKVAEQSVGNALRVMAAVRRGRLVVLPVEVIERPERAFTGKPASRHQ